MTREQQAAVRKIVDASGWDGVRAQRPDLWSLFLQERREAQRFIDQFERIA